MCISRWRRERQLRRISKAQARTTYVGPPEGEPHTACLLQELRGTLSETFRTDEELRSAQQREVALERAVAEASNLLAGTVTRAERRIGTAGNVSPMSTDVVASALWTDVACAAAARDRAQRDLDAARRLHAEAVEHSGLVSARAIDRLVGQAAAGLMLINAHLERIDRARAREDRPMLGLLGEEWIHTLVRDAVQPVDVGPTRGERAEAAGTRQWGEAGSRPGRGEQVA